MNTKRESLLALADWKIFLPDGSFLAEESLYHSAVEAPSHDQALHVT